MDSKGLLSILERANQIASSSQLDDLLDKMLDLIIEVCAAEAGTLYLLDQDASELVFKVVKDRDNPDHSPLVGKRMSADTGIAGATLQQRQAILVDDVEKDPRWFRGFTQISGRKLRNVLSFPLLLSDQPIGVVQVFNYLQPQLEIIQLLGNRMASEVDKTMLLHASRERAERLQALVDIVGHIGSSLNRDDILRMIIAYAKQLLNAEACSLFLLDLATGDLLPHVATNMGVEQMKHARVPAGKGIIGYVVRTGETVLVADASRDERHYAGVDQDLGFQSRSILAVPLRARTIQLGEERGAAKERIIGGLEALNKREDTFNQEDARLLETLANQAGTVLQIADLYANTNELFMGVVRALTAAIDAKDPYTEGHSQRVSDFSVAIAREMQLPTEMIHHLRIAGLLHDVGKIGVADTVLKKPGRLTPDEFTEIKKHPLIGARIMSEVRQLEMELPGIAEHHERVDGTGYPAGLTASEISLAGRIVAVADVFDAMTSERPYRTADSPDRVFEQMRSAVGTHFDPACVDALLRAYCKGRIHTQKEQEGLSS